MTRLRHLIHRERRRIGLFVLLVTLAAFLVYSDELGMELGIRQSAFAAVGTALGAGMLALVLLLVAPSWRHAFETTAVATLIVAVVLVRVPGVSFHDQGHVVAVLILWLCTAAAVHQLIYGGWSDRLLRLPNHVERACCHSHLDRASLWQAACPEVGRPERYWNRSVRDIAPVAENPDAVMLFHRFPNGMMMTQLIHFEQVRPGKALRYAYETLGAAPRGRHSLAMLFEQRGETMAIHLRWERAGYPLRLALMHWIDDWGGRTADRQLARLEAARRSADVARGALADA